MTHCRLATEMLSALCAEGSAMVTMEASKTTISWAVITTARIDHRLGSGSVATSTASTGLVASLIAAPYRRDISCIEGRTQVLASHGLVRFSQGEDPRRG